MGHRESHALCDHTQPHRLQSPSELFRTPTSSARLSLREMAWQHRSRSDSDIRVLTRTEFRFQLPVCRVCEIEVDLSSPHPALSNPLASVRNRQPFANAHVLRTRGDAEMVAPSLDCPPVSTTMSSPPIPHLVATDGIDVIRKDRRSTSHPHGSDTRRPAHSVRLA